MIEGLLTVGFAVAAVAAYVYSPRELPDVVYSAALLVLLAASIAAEEPVYESVGVPLYLMWAACALGLAALLTKVEQGTFGKAA